MLIQRNITRALLAVTASCFILGACDDDDGISPEDQANVIFANAMTGTNNELTLRSEGTLIGSSVAYQRFGSCQGLAPRSRDFAITAAGSTTTLASLSDQDLTSGGRYTIVATGSLVTPNLVLFTDTYTSPPSDRARIRVLNAVNSLTSFDVYVGTPGSALGTAMDSDVMFNESQTYLDVPEGLTQVRVTAPGTQTVIGTSANFTLDSREVGTIIFAPSATVGGPLTSFLVPQC